MKRLELSVCCSLLTKKLVGESASLLKLFSLTDRKCGSTAAGGEYALSLCAASAHTMTRR